MFQKKLGLPSPVLAEVFGFWNGIELASISQNIPDARSDFSENSALSKATPLTNPVFVKGEPAGSS